MKKLAIVLAVLAVFTFSIVANAATIGYIEVRKVFTEYKETKKAQDELDKKQKDFKKKLEDKQEEIDKAKKDGKTEADIKDMMKTMEKELDPDKEELMKLNEDMTKKLQADIVKAVDGVSKELGIDVVLDKQVIITGGVDITDMVLAKLNKQK